MAIQDRDPRNADRIRNEADDDVEAHRLVRRDDAVNPDAEEDVEGHRLQ